MVNDKNSKVRILIADDHMVVRMGIASVLSFEDGFEVVGEADNGGDAVKMAVETKPDVVLMDLQMPVLDGADATIRLRDELPSAKVIILTTFGTSAELKKALDGGAVGAILKNSSRAQIVDAIRGVMAGKRMIGEEIMRHIRSLKSMPDMTPRQLEILNLVAKGFSNKEIAKIVGVSFETVKDHIKQILQRMGASSRTEAASLAMNMNLI